MASNKKPRKHYRPRPVVADPVELAICSVARVPAWKQQEIMAEIAACMEQMRMGKGTQDTWARLGGHLNVAEALAARGIANDQVACIESAQSALAAVHGRAHGLRHSWTLRGPEIAALDEAIFISGVQLKYCSQGELAAASAEVLRRTDQALRGNAGAGVAVLSTEHVAHAERLVLGPDV